MRTRGKETGALAGLRRGRACGACGVRYVFRQPGRERSEGMGYQIFEMADGERVALYAQGNSIFSCLLPFGRGMLPAEIKKDYLAELEAAVFRDTVCYVYENLEHKIVLDTLGAGPSRILLTESTSAFGFCGLRLFVREGELYLFYQARSGREEGYGLYVCMPYQENKWGMIYCGAGIPAKMDPEERRQRPASQERPAELKLVETEEGMKLLAVDPVGGGVRIFDWKWELNFEECRQIEAEAHEREVNGLQAAWKQEKENWEEHREEIQAEAMARLGALEQEKEERLKQCRREYEGKVERLRAEYEGKLAKMKEEYERLLGQAKKQYEELAETAVKLQQIGRRWRDKYFEKDGEA